MSSEHGSIHDLRVAGPARAVVAHVQHVTVAAAVRARTWFMLATGPLIVLPVLGAVYDGRRLWQRRRPTPPAGAQPASGSGS